MASWIYNTYMKVEVDGIEITSIPQAKLLFSMGDISNTELDEIMKKLKPERVSLRKLGEVTYQNVPKTIVGRAIRWVGKKLKQN